MIIWSKVFNSAVIYDESCSCNQQILTKNMQKGSEYKISFHDKYITGGANKKSSMRTRIY